MHFPTPFSTSSARFRDNEKRPTGRYGFMGIRLVWVPHETDRGALRFRTSVSLVCQPIHNKGPVHSSLAKPNKDHLLLYYQVSSHLIRILTFHFQTNQPNMYLSRLALLFASAASAAEIFQRWEYSSMEPNPVLRKRQLVSCSQPVNGDNSCAATCGPGYARCITGEQPVCYNKSIGESCCGNGGSFTTPSLLPPIYPASRTDHWHAWVQSCAFRDTTAILRAAVLTESYRPTASRALMARLLLWAAPLDLGKQARRLQQDPRGLGQRMLTTKHWVLFWADWGFCLRCDLGIWIEKWYGVNTLSLRVSF